MISVLAGCQFAQQALANTCRWDTVAGPINYQANLGSVYVPRDASVGSVIGVVDQFVFSNSSGPAITCTNDGTGVTLNFSARNVAPFDRRFQGSINGERSTDKIFATNVPGVGARITLESGFNGAGNAFKPIGGSPIVPFDAVLDQRLIVPFNLSRLRSQVTLIKTGPIAPGPQIVNRHMFDGHFSDIGRGFGYNLNATVIQSQCAVGANPVSVDPVPLGTWQVSDFTHPGFSTSPAAFTITLSSCEADPTNANQANAHIRLDGANGSLPVGDGSQGVFSLSSGSTARGVGMQIMRGDGVTPVPLGADVSFGAIEDGRDKTLDFTARFYQIDNVGQIGPGRAEGALSFTITYQ
ncbi:type 1 fimbrial protein [Pseudomonas sp. C1C7]|uniref:fimbrial protein n=1 Tax=Pseudomonas sp. C1C7 TaxID=2735272 RepID=UPI001586DE10|nr:fimbrial protein [Pseudomonas sp. C1C7]NUT76733.1 type 1 fimbrial protein [Pseudomonas sp. C1C7]